MCYLKPFKLLTITEVKMNYHYISKNARITDEDDFFTRIISNMK